MFEHTLGDFDYALFDLPVLVVPYECPVDLGPFNRSLAEIAGYEQEIIGPDGALQPRLRAVWGGTEMAFFCENQIPKYPWNVKKELVGWNVYDPETRRWWGPFEMDPDKWLPALTKKHGHKRGYEIWRRLKNCKVRELCYALIVVGKMRIYVEQFVHPEVVEKGWEAVRWWRELSGEDIDQRTIEEYNNWAQFAVRIRREASESGDPAEKFPPEVEERITREIARFKEIARKEDEPLAEGPLDLPWDLRKNLVIRRRDVLGPASPHGTYEMLFVVQDEEGCYKPPDQEALDVAAMYWKTTLEKAMVETVQPGRLTPADQLAKRVENLYIALAKADAEDKARRAAEEEEEGVDSGQIQVHAERPTIYVPPGYGG